MYYSAKLIAYTNLCGLVAETELGNRGIENMNILQTGPKAASACYALCVCSQAFYLRKGARDRCMLWLFHLILVKLLRLTVTIL